ncbi:unnamed protein product [Penicillium roqueforti FM164]|uniref:Uncharacterized protein n=1 Tax=Penicillium roqueforti (strain FM164) TaxID=1365484 RepID=W6QHY7_PENRF|nr:unnamed protein product [Penicillium roqueforti FM164]
MEELLLTPTPCLNFQYRLPNLVKHLPRYLLLPTALLTAS